MPRRFNWKQNDANKLVQEYLTGQIPSARNLYHRMKQAGLHISKNTVYSRVRADLRKKRLRPRISLLAVPKPAPIVPDQRGHFRLPWQSQSVVRLLDSYIIYKREKSLREVGNDLGALFNVPPIKKEALKNHVLDRRRALTEEFEANGRTTFKKFDRLNFKPTDVEYYDMLGKEVCERIDEWYVDEEKYKEKKTEGEKEERKFFQSIRSLFQSRNNKDEEMNDMDLFKRADQMISFELAKLEREEKEMNLDIEYRRWLRKKKGKTEKHVRFAC